MLGIISLAGSSCWGLVGRQVVVAGIDLARVELEGRGLAKFAGVELAGWLKLMGLGCLSLLGLTWLAV